MCRLLISQNLSFRSRLLVKDIRQPPESLVVSFNFNREHQLYYTNLKVEPCGALVFTVVDFHLEANLPQNLKASNRDRLRFTDQSPLRRSKLIIKLLIAIDLFTSCLSRLHMCAFDSIDLSRP